MTTRRRELKRIRYSVTALAASAVVMVIALSSGLAQAGTDKWPVDKQIDKVRKATARYQDESVAIRDGYRRTNQCVQRPASAGGGAMGYHYVSEDRLDRSLDIRDPDALIYEDAADGTRRLVAVEYFLVDEDQNLGTNESPQLFERTMDGPMPGHRDPDHPSDPEWMPVHYDLHAWVWKTNPSGTFAPWNPDVSCPAASRS